VLPQFSVIVRDGVVGSEMKVSGVPVDSEILRIFGEFPWLSLIARGAKAFIQIGESHMSRVPAEVVWYNGSAVSDHFEVDRVLHQVAQEWIDGPGNYSRSALLNGEEPTGSFLFAL